MKAVYAERPFQIGLRDIPVPKIRDDEVLICVAYAGVCASDLHAFRGVHAFRKPPVMLGHEVSGTICEIGSAVTGFQIGQPVTVMPQIGCGQCPACKSGQTNRCTKKILPGTSNWIGTFGEYFVAPASVLCPLGEVPLDLGSITEPLAVAVHVMQQMPSDHGENLVILGAGAIAMMLLVIAPSYGFRNIMMTDIVDENLKLARELGAAKTVNVLHEDAATAAREYFGDPGCENTIIGAGSTDILAQAIDLTAPGGNIVYYAMITKEMTFNTYPIVFKELKLHGSLNYTMDDFDAAIRLLNKHCDTMRRIVTHTFPLEKADEAFEILDKRTEFAVKMILSVHGEV